MTSAGEINGLNAVVIIEDEDGLCLLELLYF